MIHPFSSRRRSKTASFVGLALLIGVAHVSRAAEHDRSSARIVQNLDFDWRFEQRDVEKGQDPALDTAAWRTVDLPHDWSIEGEYRQDNPAGGAGAYLPGGGGGDRRANDVPPEWAGER